MASLRLAWATQQDNKTNRKELICECGNMEEEHRNGQ